MLALVGAAIQPLAMRGNSGVSQLVGVAKGPSQAVKAAFIQALLHGFPHRR